MRKTAALIRPETPMLQHHAAPAIRMAETAAAG